MATATRWRKSSAGTGWGRLNRWVSSVVILGYFFVLL